MKQQSSKKTMRTYYEQVQDNWVVRQAESHPYANNQSWQRNFAALKKWIATHKLEECSVLEVGCGTGLLQDVVTNYIGMDITKNSSVFIRKTFITGSAMQLPFADSSFDAVFSIWVLEHIEHPEAMLDEIRRVLRPHGTLFLVVAYDVRSWISQGLHRRPFRELNLQQCLIKLTIPLRASVPYRVITTLIRRSGDLLCYLRSQPTHLRFRRLNPNFEIYWDSDADACVSLDAYNVALYFLSRGDKPLYPVDLIRGLFLRSGPQIYQINK